MDGFSLAYSTVRYPAALVAPVSTWASGAVAWVISGSGEGYWHRIRVPWGGSTIGQRHCDLTRVPQPPPLLLDSSAAAATPPLLSPNSPTTAAASRLIHVARA